MNRPIALICYICGRQFGTKSLAIHIKSCQKKWQYEQNLKPPKERRPCPQPPKGLNTLLEKNNITKKDIEIMNSGTFNTYMQQALIECEYCGRKFNPNSLKPHQKACKINPMIKKPYISNQQKAKMAVQEKEIKVGQKNYNYQNSNFNNNNINQNLQQCYKCGRKFTSDRVGKHQKVCKGEGIKLRQKETKQELLSNKKDSNTKPKQPEKPAKWRIQHEQFQNALKYMKQMKKIQQNGGKISDLPPPPKSNYDHYIECQYCGRKYAADVAERHIPKCKNIINKPGGIKPSQIQQKYVQGTGAHNINNIKQQIYKAPVISTTKSNSVKKDINPVTNNSFNPYQLKPTTTNLGKQTYTTSNQQYGKLYKK